MRNALNLRTANPSTANVTKPRVKCNIENLLELATAFTQAIAARLASSNCSNDIASKAIWLRFSTRSAVNKITSGRSNAGLYRPNPRMIKPANNTT